MIFIYTVGQEDEIVKLNELPSSSAGAPMPIVLSDEHITVIAYYIQEDELNYDSDEEPIAIVTFTSCRASMFGPPNDEAFNGHPLYSKGLRPYSAFIIKNSSWIKILLKMNEVHPYHSPELFEGYKHYILAFHDSTFECVAENYQAEIFFGTLYSAIDVMREKLK